MSGTIPWPRLRHQRARRLHRRMLPLFLLALQVQVCLGVGASLLRVHVCLSVCLSLPASTRVCAREYRARVRTRCRARAQRESARETDARTRANRRSSTVRCFGQHVAARRRGLKLKAGTSPLLTQRGALGSSGHEGAGRGGDSWAGRRQGKAASSKHIPQGRLFAAGYGREKQGL